MFKVALSAVILAAGLVVVPFTASAAEDTIGSQADGSLVIVDESTMTPDRGGGGNNQWQCWASGYKNSKRGNIVGMPFWTAGAAQRSVLRRCASLGYRNCFITGCRQLD